MKFLGVFIEMCEDEEQELPDCLITEEDKKTTIAQAKKSAENIIKGDKELNE